MQRILEGQYNACRIRNEIFIAPCDPVNFCMRYWHERGHALADRVSFLSGKILQPDTVKSSQLPLTEIERRNILIKLAYPLPTDNTPRYFLPVAESVLDFFTSGDSNKHPVTVHPETPPEDIRKLLLNADWVPGINIDKEGTMHSTRSRVGVRSELPAIAVEMGCVKLLENTLATISPGISITNTGREGSHKIAQKIVERAYNGSGWQLPSTRDLGIDYSK